MKGAIFMETLRRSWRQMFYWGILLALPGYYTIVLIPNVDTLKQYEELMKSMPPILLQAFGASDVTTMASAEGFISFSFLTYSLIIMLVYAVLAGLNITASEEDDGIMDMLLSLPVPRWRVMAEKYAVYSLMCIGIIVLSYIGLYLGAASVTLEIDMSLITIGGLNIILGLMLVMAFTALVATTVRRRSTATIIVVTVLIASYFINFLGNAASGTAAAALKVFSFFQYADAQYVVLNGFSAASLVILAVATGVLLAGSLWAWERRDVGI